MFFSAIVFSLLTRFYNLGWGNGYFFHPDENNMATALAQLSLHNFNPHFFAYGQFPLYLGFFSLLISHQVVNLANSILVLRFWSAIFSILSIFIFYKIYKNKYFLWLLIFSPGLIQIAHFGTTESLLVLVFAVNIYLSKLILLKPNNKKLYLFSAINTGVGLASKISSLIFLAPILLAILFSFKKYKNFLYPIFYSSFLLLVSCIFFIILSPYNLIANQDFRSALSYETQVATGELKVFYTQQFSNTIPYIFQLVKIFPFVTGIPVFVLAIIGLWRKPNKFSFVIAISVLVYFIYFGQLYVKWTRFMSPIFFVFPLLTAILITNIKNKIFRLFLLFTCLIPGIYFMNLYFHTDIRLQASSWIDKNIPKKSIIFSEGGNVVNLPSATIFFDFYNPDYSQLITEITNSEYIIVPSRRVFKNNFSPNYYSNLFSGKLGFSEIYKISPQTDVYINPEDAEETWSVFDHPTIRIYKKVKQLQLSDYETLLKS